MNVQHDYIKEYSLLINIWTGQWSEVDYQKVLIHFGKLRETTTIKNIIIDISNLDFEFNDIKYIDELVQISKKIKNKDYRVVYITSKPQDVVFTHLYANELQITNSYLGCSTVEKALDILQIKIPLNDFENHFAYLKSQF